MNARATSGALLLLAGALQLGLAVTGDGIDPTTRRAVTFFVAFAWFLFAIVMWRRWRHG